ncbi:MAG: CoA transferase [Pseudomonadota bacterium]
MAAQPQAGERAGGPGDADGPLSGIQVLDLTRVLAGPLCTMQLGDLGAEVIKVESPGGDDTRAWGPPFIQGESAYFLGLNRNKRSIVLDLATPEGLETLRELIRRADVLVDNYKSGTFEKWGLTDAWFELNAPALVRCSITGYGDTGPKASLPGYDFILQAETGLMSICGEPQGQPMKYGVAIVDIATGLLACNGILAALQARNTSGRGQKVHASLFETGVFLLANVASNALATGTTPQRYGNGHPNIVPYTTYQACDAAVAVAVGNDKQFERFAELLGRPELARDEAYRTNAARVQNREALDALIATDFSTAPAQTWVGRLMQAGIPVGKINSVDEALAAPQCAAREMVQTVEHPTGAPVRMVGFPVKLSQTPARVRRPPPLHGEHTDEILQSLGHAPARLEER